jgi:hypothetical protein
MYHATKWGIKELPEGNRCAAKLEADTAQTAASFAF